MRKSFRLLDTGIPKHPLECFLPPPLVRLGKQSGVEDICFDMCQYRLCDLVSGLPYRKSTCLLGKLPDLGRIATTCDGSHQHQHVGDGIMLNGKSVKRSAVAGAYPIAFCPKLAALVRKTLNQNAHRCDLRRVKNLRA